MGSPQHYLQQTVCQMIHLRNPIVGGRDCRRTAQSILQPLRRRLLSVPDAGDSRDFDIYAKPFATFNLISTTPQVGLKGRQHPEGEGAEHRNSWPETTPHLFIFGLWYLVPRRREGKGALMTRTPTTCTTWTTGIHQFLFKLPRQKAFCTPSRCLFCGESSP